MHSPFPGMDPYLEAPGVWEAFHDRLIFHLGSLLQERLPEGYVAEFRQRAQLLLAERTFIPDVEVSSHNPVARPSGSVAALVSEAAPPTYIRIAEEEVTERYLEIAHIPDGRLVTVIELASPVNKSDPRGRAAYLEKQRGILASPVHLVEIDLLRSGGHWCAVPERLAETHRPYDYLICVSRADDRSLFACHFQSLPNPLPAVEIPLDPEVGPALLPLQDALSQAYAQGRYFDRLPYSRPAVPPLTLEDADWADALLREAGLRS